MWQRTTDADGNPIPLFLQELPAGMGWQIAYSWAYDHDPGAMRTKQWRRIMVGGLWPVPRSVRNRIRRP